MNRYGQWCYTYLIGWRKLDVWYYGYRAANKVEPELDLLVEYDTSSEKVHEFVSQHGQPDVVRIHKLFETKVDANTYEIKFLKRVGAVRSDRWLNGNDYENFRSPDKHRDSSKEKMSKARKGKKFGPHSEETRRKISEGQLGRKFSEETKAKLSERGKGRTLSESHRRAIARGNLNKTVSEETRMKLRKPKPKVTCPHCNKTGGASPMKRHHFDNCKVTT